MFTTLDLCEIPGSYGEKGLNQVGQTKSKVLSVDGEDTLSRHLFRLVDWWIGSGLDFQASCATCFVYHLRFWKL